MPPHWLIYIGIVIITIGTVAAGFVGIGKIVRFISAFFIAWRGTEYEKDYSYFVKDLLNKGIYARPKREINKVIIVDEGGNNLNTRIRKLFLTKIRKMTLETILITQFKTESERIAYLLKQAVSEVLRTFLLEIDFKETLIIYMAYKFAKRVKRIGKSIEEILFNELSTLKYNVCVMKLDSTNFEKQIVLNDVPKAKPLLEETVLPIIGILTQQIQTKKYDSNGDGIKDFNKQRDFFIKWIGRLCDDKVRIMWIASSPIKRYLKFLTKDNSISKFEFFIFGARRSNINVLDHFMEIRLPQAYPQYDFQYISVEGNWERRSKLVNHKWIFVHKKLKRQQNYVKQRSLQL
jgi:hypothetical protein